VYALVVEKIKLWVMKDIAPNAERGLLITLQKNERQTEHK
jgi:hypothetical protein